MELDLVNDLIHGWENQDGQKDWGSMKKIRIFFQNIRNLINSWTADSPKQRRRNATHLWTQLCLDLNARWPTEPLMRSRRIAEYVFHLVLDAAET